MAIESSEGAPLSRPGRAGLWRAAAGLWAVGTTVLLLMPGSPVPIGKEADERWIEALELSAHVILFLVQAILVSRGWLGAGRASDPGPALGAARLRPWLWILAVFCVALEVLQIPVPHRGFELIDVLAGWLGLAVGFLPWRRRELPYTAPPGTRGEGRIG